MHDQPKKSLPLGIAMATAGEADGHVRGAAEGALWIRLQGGGGEVGEEGVKREAAFRCESRFVSDFGLTLCRSFGFFDAVGG